MHFWQLFLVTLALCIAVRGEPLHSPWKSVPRRSPDTAAYICPAEPSLPRSLSFDGYYTDAHHSIKDPAAEQAYETAVSIPDTFAHDVARAADKYRRTGNVAAGRCVVELLTAAASQQAFTEARLSPRGSRQGFYVRTWLCSGLALAYLKVEGTEAETSSQHDTVAAWLAVLAEHVRRFHNELATVSAGDSRNNHHSWAALAAAAVGVVTNRRDLLDWGIRAGRDGLRQITAEGTLPLEMNRASMALHYHLFAAAPLVILAELGEANGLRLYAENDGALRRLVLRAVSGLVDPSFFARRTGVPQQAQDPDSGATISWAAPFARRFPNPTLNALLAKAPQQGYYLLGGMPPP
jgi:poly(beta-D-mannuronate) lyase